MKTVVAVVETCGGFAVRKDSGIWPFRETKYMSVDKDCDWWTCDYKSKYCIFKTATEAAEAYYLRQDIVVEYL